MWQYYEGQFSIFKIFVNECSKNIGEYSGNMVIYNCIYIQHMI
jgi:hypothetical protein